MKSPEPEWFEPVDTRRITASIAFDGTVASLGVSPAGTIYGRAESVLKEIVGLGVHPRGLLNHPRNFSQVNALTLGYVRDMPGVRWSRVGIGADITGYRTSTDLIEYFGSPLSFHVFVRWRPSHVSAAHVH